MSLEKIGSFLERAVECERLANRAPEPRHCEVLLYLASTWRALAAEEAGQRIPQHRDSMPLSSKDKSHEQ
jgi:hypothetical protein